MKAAKIISCLIAIIIGLADAVLVYYYGVEGSISRWIQDTSFKSPLFVVMLMFLLGHFWGLPKIKKEKDDEGNSNN